jgi:hydrogenase small subunit
MNELTLGESLRRNGVSRRGFLKFCTAAASMMALPPSMAEEVAKSLEQARRPSVIWLSFQECTGCTESLTRSHAPTVENLILEHVSLDYHHTLQAASGQGAEAAREEAMRENQGRYVLVVDGSVPIQNPGYSTIAGISNLDMLKEAAEGAAVIIAVGTCAAFGGLPHARPNPTGAVSVAEALPGKTVVNVPGCPPVPIVITGVLAHFLTFGTLPALDRLNRPMAFYGKSIHDRCYRRPFYDRGQFAETFDDEGARAGWCLYRLGCKGPMTYNACATMKWNDGTSWPVESGHGCLGCSEPDFWDVGGFYRALSIPTGDIAKASAYAVVGGAAAGVAAAVFSRRKQAEAKVAVGRQPVTVDELDKTP